MNPNKGNKEKQVEDAVKIDLGSESSEFEPNPTNIACQSPDEISNLGSTNGSPKHPPLDSTLSKRRTFNRSKTRFDQHSPVLDSNDVDVDDDDEIYRKIKPRRRRAIKFPVQLLVFLLILACLLTSLLVKKLKGKLIFGVQVWKWVVLVMVTLSGLLISRWFVNLIVYLMESKIFFHKKKALYFTYALKYNIVVFIWIGGVLSTWLLLLKPQVMKTHKSKSVLKFITMTLVTFLIGSFLWLLKTTFIKILESSFHYNRFFDRLQEAVFHHYVIQALSERPLIDFDRKLSKVESCISQVSFTEYTSAPTEKKVDPMNPIFGMAKKKTHSMDMELLFRLVTRSGLPRISSMVNQDVVGGMELDDMELTSEEADIAAAVKTFYNVIDKKNKNEQ
ncbi:mechanosensitive ion channel protein 10-like [Silene latifolia]|uniref:mechanosensitive ion channel protein 10-like n=1 Tax=Silene latifolia TaxID=37657 RepID=UPI003D76AA5B